MPAPSPDPIPKPVLFLTHSEHSHANPILALSHPFLHNPSYEVHIASFPTLAVRDDRLFESAISGNDPTSSTNLFFHPIRGPTLTQITERNKIDRSHVPGIRGAMGGLGKKSEILFGMTPEEYLQGYESVIEVVKGVKPVAAILDPTFAVAVDVCRAEGLKCVFVWSGSLQNVVGGTQPGLARLWKYPVIGSGYAFPIPIVQIPSNVLLAMLTSPIISPPKPLQGARKSSKLTHTLQLLTYTPNDLHISPSLSDIDYPFTIPPNVFPCGPLLSPSLPLSQQNPDLHWWLHRAPTILINLGATFTPPASFVVEMARGLRMVMRVWENLQVLWKVRLKDDSFEVKKLLEDIVAPGRVKVVEWLEESPDVVMRESRTCLYVHRGSGGAFGEGCRAGLPQVIIPQWLEDYHCAGRVEWLGIGVYANRRVAPRVDASELSEAIVKALSDSEMRARAEFVGRVCREAEGRDVGYRRILDFVEGRGKETQESEEKMVADNPKKRLKTGADLKK